MCLCALRASRTYLSYVLTCYTCLRAFVSLLLKCLPFLRALRAFIFLSTFIFLRSLRVFIFSTCLTCLHFFYVLYVFFTCLTCPHLFTCLTWLLFLRVFTFLSVSNFWRTLCAFIFYIKCGTTHNQPKQIGISKNKVE